MQRRSLVLSLLALATAAPLACAQGIAADPGGRFLFDGKDLSQWSRKDSDQAAAWKLEDGTMTAGGGDIQTREKFADFRLHLEFAVPYMPDKKGQARGNSGVIIQNRYEVQVLDSYGKEHPGTGDCGAIYSQSAALVNACKPPNEWQTYDIVFRTARYENGQMTEKPRISVFQNGILVQNNFEIQGYTADHEGFKGRDVSTPGPIVLQDHGNPVKYRNIWIVPLPLKGNEKYE